MISRRPFAIISMISRGTLSRDGFRFELHPCETGASAGLYEAADESPGSVATWMAWLHEGYSLKDAQDWAARAVEAWEAGREYEFVIVDRDDGRVAGACGLNQINPKDCFCNLGYWVRESKRRLGAATQAALLAKEFGLKVLGLNRVEIVVAVGNEASRRVAEKTGAIYEGILRRRTKVGDKVHDSHMYAFIQGSRV